MVLHQANLPSRDQEDLIDVCCPPLPVAQRRLDQVREQALAAEAELRAELRQQHEHEQAGLQRRCEKQLQQVTLGARQWQAAVLRQAAGILMQ